MDSRFTYADPALVKGCLAREKEAFEILVNTYFPVLCSFANGIVKDSETAKDIVQEVFIRFWNGKEIFKEFNSLKAWLYLSTRNRALNELKSKKRSEEHHTTAHQQGQTTENNIFSAIVKAETLASVYSVVNQLPLQMRTVFELHYIEGMPIREIATRLGIRSKTVSNHRYNALCMLRAKLVDDADALSLLCLLGSVS